MFRLDPPPSIQVMLNIWMLTFTPIRISNLANVWLIVNDICHSQHQTYFYGIHKHRALQKMKLHPETECYLKRSYFIEDLSFACEYSHIYSCRKLNRRHPNINHCIRTQKEFTCPTNHFIPNILPFRSVVSGNIIITHQGTSWQCKMASSPSRPACAKGSCCRENSNSILLCVLLFLSPCLWLTIKRGGSCAPTPVGRQ